MTIVNDNSRVVNKLEASLNDDARVIIYDRHMFLIQVTDHITLDLNFMPKMNNIAILYNASI